MEGYTQWRWLWSQGFIGSVRKFGEHVAIYSSSTHTQYRMTHTLSAGRVCLFSFWLACVCTHVHVCGRFKASLLKWNKRELSIKEGEKNNSQTRGKLWDFWPRDGEKTLQKETGENKCLRAVRERPGHCVPLWNEVRGTWLGGTAASGRVSAGRSLSTMLPDREQALAAVQPFCSLQAKQPGARDPDISAPTPCRNRRKSGE